MKLINKGDIAALGMVAGVGVVTGLIYICGKLQGKQDAFCEITEVVEELIKEAKVEKN